MDAAADDDVAIVVEPAPLPATEDEFEGTPEAGDDDDVAVADAGKTAPESCTAMYKIATSGRVRGNRNCSDQTGLNPFSSTHFVLYFNVSDGSPNTITVTYGEGC